MKQGSFGVSVDLNCIHHSLKGLLTFAKNLYTQVKKLNSEPDG